ncbi:MAG: asparagine synthase, partial [Thermoproteota archaeon]
MNKMKKELLDKIENSIKENIVEKKIGIAFSGGVDSTLISKICSDLGYDVTLLTIGFPE